MGSVLVCYGLGRVEQALQACRTGVRHKGGWRAGTRSRMVNWGAVTWPSQLAKFLAHCKNSETDVRRDVQFLIMIYKIVSLPLFSSLTRYKKAHLQAFRSSSYRPFRPAPW